VSTEGNHGFFRAYVESQSQSSLAGRDESVEQRIRSMTMSRATLRIENDNMHQQFFQTAGVLTIRARMSIDEPTVSRFQAKLDQQTHLPALPKIAITPQFPRNQHLPSLRKRQVALYIDVGTITSLSSGENVGLFAVLGFDYIASPPLSLGLMFLGAEHGHVTEGRRGVMVETGSLVLKLAPINGSIRVYQRPNVSFEKHKMLWSAVGRS